MKNEIGLWVFQCRLVNRSTYNGASMNVGVYVDDVCADFSPLRRKGFAEKQTNLSASLASLRLCG
jgi:hypothetical protein